MKKIKLLVFSLLLIFGYTTVKALDYEEGYYYGGYYLRSHHILTGPDGNLIHEITPSLYKLDYVTSSDGKTMNDAMQRLVYCAQFGVTSYSTIKYNDPIKLSQSDVYASNAGKLRAILNNSYPYVSIDKMKEILTNDKVDIDLTKLSDQEIVTAIQAAVWKNLPQKDTNGNLYTTNDFKYKTTINFLTESDEGYLDQSNEWKLASKTLARTGVVTNWNEESAYPNKNAFIYNTDDNVENRINTLINYLDNLKAINLADNDELAINNIKSTYNYDPDNNYYVTYLTFDLANSNYINKVFSIESTMDVKEKELTNDNNTYTYKIITNENPANNTFTVNLTAKKISDVLLYESATSQNYVGLEDSTYKTVTNKEVVKEIIENPNTSDINIIKITLIAITNIIIVIIYKKIILKKQV